MNIHSTAATVGRDADIRSNASSTKESQSATDGASSSKTAKAGSNATSSAGPAATVSISSDARTLLRQAGVSQSDISRINLKDKNAVMRAIQRARMQHGQQANAGKPGAAASDASAKNANAASRAAATSKLNEPESAAEGKLASPQAQPTKTASAGDTSTNRSAA